MNGRMVAVNGAELWVEEAGAGPAVMLVHSGVTDSRMWDAQFAALSERYRVVRHDLRGFGRSTIPPMPFSHHEDLLALMNALGIEAACLVGASMGGEVVLATALEWPDRVRGVVVANTRAGTHEASGELRAGWKAVDEALEAGDLEGAVEIELRMWVDGPHRTPDEVDPAVRERVREMDRALLPREAEQELADERDLEPPVVERLEEVACPVLVVVGTLDLAEVLTSADELVRRIPGARRVDIADAAHLPSMERPEAFNRLVLDFLSGVG